MSTGSPLREGQRCAGCIVAREIGRGAQSVVHAAYDERAQEWRALKLLLTPGDRPTLRSSIRGSLGGSLGAAAQRESAAAGLQHPGIVRVYGSGESAGLPWLLMELLPGTDLTRYTRAARRLPVPVVARIGRRLAEALACAHAAGVVHRDLKPANVMLDWAGDRVVITDFGLARSADAERTRTGLVLGSPAYMAPELLAGQAPTPASDLYALGVLLFELLACRLPFEDAGLGALLRQVAEAPPPDLLALLPPEAPLPALAALVQTLLAKQPGQRPPDAAATVQRLQRLLAGDDGPMSRG